MEPTISNRATPDGSVAAPRLTIIQVHTQDLPCAACSWGVKHLILDELDFCQDCAHYHIESDCPVQRVA